jgi:hypothetical protein
MPVVLVICVGSPSRLRIAGCLEYGEQVDAYTQQRVLELRKEIARLQRENDIYRRQEHRTASQENQNELRRLRLVAIQDELLRLSGRSTRIQ